jgi:small-conductance mechanosensitive channel
MSTRRSLWVSIIGAVALAVTAPLALPAAPAVAEESSEKLAPEPGLVAVFNRPIVILRASLFGVSPTQRAERVQERINAFLAEDLAGDVSTRTITEGVMIQIGGRDALLFASGDVDLVAGDTLEQGVAETVRRLRSAIADRGKQHQWPFLARATGAVLAATALFALAIWLIWRTSRWILPRVVRAEQNVSERLVKSGFEVLGYVTTVSPPLVRIVVGAILGFSAYAWLAFCLQQFPYTQPWGKGLGAFLVSTLSGMALGVVRTLPGLFVVVVIVVATRFVEKVVRSFFSAIQEGRARVGWLEPEAARATSQLVAALIWVFAVVMMYPYLPGSGSQAFQGMSVFLGVLVSLGASGVVGQFTSGLVLMYSRALKPGDFVRVGDHEGTVIALGFLSTKLLTKKNEEVYVPNTVLMSTTMKNFSRRAQTEGVILYTTITIGYSAPWRQVHAMLLEAAKRTPGLLQQPPPFVLQTALSDFYVEYQLNAYLERPDQRVETLSVLHHHIQDLFNEHGVQIMSPHYEMDPASPVLAPKETWYAKPAAPPETGTHAGDSVDGRTPVK